MVFEQGCEVVVMAFHRNPKKSNFFSYSPAGSAGEQFLLSNHGKLVWESFRHFMLHQATGMLYFSISFVLPIVPRFISLLTFLLYVKFSDFKWNGIMWLFITYSCRVPIPNFMSMIFLYLVCLYVGKLQL